MQFLPSNELSKTRIQSQLKGLEEIDGLTYRISHKYNRTLIFVYTKVCIEDFIEPEYDIQDQEYQSQVNRFDENIFQSCSPSKHNHQQEEVQNSEGLKDKKLVKIDVLSQGQSAESMVFLVILHHSLYPFEAPFVTISQANLFPRVDDFRNYFYDIMGVKVWWPLITLKQMIAKLPYFAIKLERQIREGLYTINKRQYPLSYPIFEQDLLQSARGLLLLNAKVSFEGKSFKESKIGFSFFNLYFFSQLSELSLKQMVRSESIDTVTQHSGRKNQIKVHINNNSILIKINTITLKKEQFDYLRFYLQFYQITHTSAQLSTMTPKDTLTTIKMYQQFMRLSDAVRNQDAIQWAKNGLRTVMRIKSGKT